MQYNLLIMFEHVHELGFISPDSVFHGYHGLHSAAKDFFSDTHGHCWKMISSKDLCLYCGALKRERTDDQLIM